MRRTLISADVSRLLRDCRLSREGTLQILVGLHNELPQRYNRYRMLRHSEDDRLFLFFATIVDGRHRHTFTFFVDDSTSAVHLIIVEFEHESRRLT